MGRAPQALEDDVDVLEHALEVEGVGDAACAEALGDLGVSLDELPEVALLLPGPQRMALHEAVGIVSGEARLDERERAPAG